jgi:hypothetical protein
MDGFFDGSIFLFPNFKVMNSPHKDNPVQTKKRTVKSKWLMRSIPKYGASAKATLMDK